VNGVRASQDTLEELFEEAPCGYLATELDGRIVRANRTFRAWTGYADDALVGRRFQEFLTKGSRIYFETHFAPLLQMHGQVREIALDLVCADDTRMPALVNSMLRRAEDGRAQHVRTIIFDATDRRRYEQELLRSRSLEQDIARELQAGLLAGTFPQAPGLDIDVAYRPAVLGLQVGGDWYDAFWLDEGHSVALVVGDVVGHGIGAATVMGQLRSATRALAAGAGGPAEVLERLDQYSRRHQVGSHCTLTYAQLTLETGELTYACAGHPPPLLLPADGEPLLLWDGRSPPIDATFTPQARPEASLTLAAGSTLALYSDGLVERRGECLDDGIERLRRQADSHRYRELPELIRAVVHDLSGTSHPDDVCLLVARLGSVAVPSTTSRPAREPSR
jgi:PAS domain S-box-containing protein